MTGGSSEGKSGGLTGRLADKALRQSGPHPSGASFQTKVTLLCGTSDGSLAGLAASGRKSQCRRILGSSNRHFKRQLGPAAGPFPFLSML
jgi:hypothetical protein